MSAPIPDSGWICKACAFKNTWEGRECQMCGTARSKRQAIGARKAIDAPPAAVSAAAASARPQPPPNNVHPPGVILDIVGTAGVDRGRSCDEHKCCGAMLQEDMVVRVRKEQILVPDYIAGKGNMKEETALTVNWVSDGIDRCRVGFLPRPYLVQARLWDGLLFQVVRVVTKNDPSQARRAKFYANKGYARVALISPLPLGLQTKFPHTGNALVKKLEMERKAPDEEGNSDGS